MLVLELVTRRLKAGKSIYAVAGAFVTVVLATSAALPRLAAKLSSVGGTFWVRLCFISVSILLACGLYEWFMLILEQSENILVRLQLAIASVIWRGPCSLYVTEFHYWLETVPLETDVSDYQKWLQKMLRRRNFVVRVITEADPGSSHKKVLQTFRKGVPDRDRFLVRALLPPSQREVRPLLDRVRSGTNFDVVLVCGGKDDRPKSAFLLLPQVPRDSKTAPGERVYAIHVLSSAERNFLDWLKEVLHDAFEPQCSCEVDLDNADA
jgi:hypothetical protein